MQRFWITFAVIGIITNTFVFTASAKPLEDDLGVTLSAADYEEGEPVYDNSAELDPGNQLDNSPVSDEVLQPIVSTTVAPVSPSSSTTPPPSTTPVLISKPTIKRIVPTFNRKRPAFTKSRPVFTKATTTPTTTPLSTTTTTSEPPPTAEERLETAATQNKPDFTNFCPWGICKFPGFLFGAFFRIPSDELPTIPNKNSENVVFIQTPDETTAKPEKTVIYLLPHEIKHMINKQQKEDFVGEESKNPFHNDRFEVVYLNDAPGSSQSLPNSEGKNSNGGQFGKLQFENEQQFGRRRATRKIKKRIEKPSTDHEETNYSVSISYSVSQ